MAKTAPDESDLLCENCGYTLNGLPGTGNCPECGSPIKSSTVEDMRTSPAWERDADPRPAWQRFIATSSAIIFTPGRFFRTLNSRGPLPSAVHFARIYWTLVALMLGSAAWLHMLWFRQHILAQKTPMIAIWLALIALCILAYAIIEGSIRLAARLTAWEASYRGYRLPYPVVLRALAYHAAHLFPVGMLALFTVAAYTGLQRRDIFSYSTDNIYLYTLCGEIILAAAYLFQTYWIGMRKLMYANR